MYIYIYMYIYICIYIYMYIYIFGASTIPVIIFWDFLMFKVFLSPQVKRNAIIINKYGIYKFPDKLPNDLRLKILGYQENLKAP